MTLGGIEDEIVQATERLSKSVVKIEAGEYRARGYRNFAPVEGSGSGVITDRMGHVITNNHVVDSADVVSVALSDGRTYRGELIGSDEGTDIAVLRLENAGNESFDFAALGDSDHLKVGQIALAIGNSLGLPGEPTVSLGVISALARPLPGADFIHDGFIQTDAAVNPGNSGGPLANLRGEVIGINTAIIPYANGMGFAIPVNTVKQTMTQILEKGRVTRPWIGISAVDVDKAIARYYELGVDNGLLVIGVSKYSPAEEAGLRAGDVISRIDGRPTRIMKDLLSELSRIAIGAGVRLTIVRRGYEREISLRLVEMPGRIGGGRARGR